MQINQVLENQSGVACIMDDMVVYGKDVKQHDERLDQVLGRLSKANITLNEEKCEFRKSEIHCLGQIIGRNGVKADPDKVSAVVNMDKMFRSYGVSWEWLTSLESSYQT